LNRYVTSLLGLLQVILVAVLSGCGGGNSNNNSNTSVTSGVGQKAVLYVISAGTPAVGTFTIGMSDVLLIGPNNYATGTNPQGIVTDSQHRYIYVLNNPGAGLAGGVLQYQITSGNGALEVIQATNNPSNIQQAVLPAPTGLTPLSMAIDQNNKFVFTANSGDNTVSTFSVGTVYGDLNAVATSPTTVGSTPVSLVAKGNYLFIANQGTLVIPASVSAYSFDGNGALTAVGNAVNIGGHPTAIASDGHYVYVADGTANTVSVLSFDTTAGLSATGTSASVGTNPVNLYITPGNKYLYVANAGSNNVSGFSLNGSGGLSAISGSPWGSGVTPSYVTSNNGVSNLFVANIGNGTVSSFSINGSGSLSPVVGSPYNALGFLAPNGLVSLQ
jgi:6-phosphogluconolactonase (cycloisomerase 2 family)